MRPMSRRTRPIKETPHASERNSAPPVVARQAHFKDSCNPLSRTYPLLPPQNLVSISPLCPAVRPSQPFHFSLQRRRYVSVKFARGGMSLTEILNRATPPEDARATMEFEKMRFEFRGAISISTHGSAHSYSTSLSFWRRSYSADASTCSKSGKSWVTARA